MDESELRKSLAALHSASFAWAVTCCRDRELAEDVLQSVYVKLLDGRAPFQGRSSFQTWLFAVIRNVALDVRRKNWWSRVLRLEFESLVTAAGGRPDDSNRELEHEDEQSQIRAALDSLPVRQRQVAHLVFYESLTVGEAAEAMGVTVGTARQHYARAKQALKTNLKHLWNQTDEPITR
jgi:RNA polymerase sigma-70 factor (ECF subfamily)